MAVSKLRLELPTIQSWSCHSCGGCCREHQIEITEAERIRIERQNWMTVEGFNESPVEWFAGSGANKRWRLRRRISDGGCVFLDDDGRCKIHAKFGEPEKPLACQIYPYAFHPGPTGIAVSLRFSCPSVVQNRGTPLSQQENILRKYLAEVVPRGMSDFPVPEISTGVAGRWSSIGGILDLIVSQWNSSSLSLESCIVRTLSIIELVRAGAQEIANTPEPRLLMAQILKALQGLTPDSSASQRPTSVGMSYFRLLLAHYVRHETPTTGWKSWGPRFRSMWSAARMVKGTGLTPRFSKDYVSVQFDQLQIQNTVVPEEANELLRRYFIVKLQGMHFCGPGHFGWTLVDGLMSLLLMIPVTTTLGKWQALSNGRTTTTLEDLQVALATADHHFGYNEQLGSSTTLRMVRGLFDSGDLSLMVLAAIRTSAQKSGESVPAENSRVAPPEST